MDAVLTIKIKYGGKKCDNKPLITAILYYAAAHLDNEGLLSTNNSDLEAVSWDSDVTFEGESNA